MKNSKRIIAFVLVMILAVASASCIAFADDIDYSQWNSGAGYPSDIYNTQYFMAVKILIDRGVITGDSDGLFHPEKSITRAEFAVIMAKSTNNINSGNQNNYSDLSGYDWAKPYINAAANAGLIKGVGGGKYQPGRNVTYAEVMTVILRAAAPSFDQTASAGTWPQNVINYAQMYNSMGDTVIYDWNAAATKGDVAKLVYRNMPKDVATAGKVTLSTTTVYQSKCPTTVSVPAPSSSVTTTYQWYCNGTKLAGETSNSITIPASTAVGDIYYVEVTTKKTGYAENTIKSGNCTVKP